MRFVLLCSCTDEALKVSLYKRTENSTMSKYNPTKPHGNINQQHNIWRMASTTLDTALQDSGRYIQNCTTDIKTLRFWRAAILEFLGSMVLVIFGCGAWTTSSRVHDPEEHILLHRIALSFGLIYGVMAYILEPKEGALMNPAVTLAMLITNKLNILRVLVYTISQSCGSLVGAMILQCITPALFRNKLGCTTLDMDVTPLQGFLVELIATCMFVFVVFACFCNPQRELREMRQGGDGTHGAPFIVGMLAVCIHLFAVSV